MSYLDQPLTYFDSLRFYELFPTEFSLTQGSEEQVKPLCDHNISILLISSSQSSQITLTAGERNRSRNRSHTFI